MFESVQAVLIRGHGVSLFQGCPYRVMYSYFQKDTSSTPGGKWKAAVVTVEIAAGRVLWGTVLVLQPHQMVVVSTTRVPHLLSREELKTGHNLFLLQFPLKDGRFARASSVAAVRCVVWRASVRGVPS